MEMTTRPTRKDSLDPRNASLRLVVESAVRRVASERNNSQPRTRDDWIERLCDALVSESETSHQSVLGAMVSNGISQADILQNYIPDVARLLGEMWLKDKASFVDVTVGAGRLQRLYREAVGSGAGGWSSRSIPLGQSVVMVVPSFESHSLGAFAAADQLRRHGAWVHMAIGLNASELCNAVCSSRCSMIGFSAATLETLEGVTGLIGYLRETVPNLPPIVLGGRIVELANDVAQRCGADYAVTTARQALSICGLATVSTSLAPSEII